MNNNNIKNKIYDFIEYNGCLNIKKILPIINWLPNYSYKKHLLKDIIAGITIGTMVIPQSMAYSNIAGLSPIFGLYSAFMGCFLYFLLGTSKDLAIGPTAVMSLIISHSFTKLDYPPNSTDNLCQNIGTNNYNYDYCCFDGEEYFCTSIKKAIAASLISGCYQLLLSLINFGSLVDIIGFPVLNAFTTSAAIIIFTSQIKHIFGLTNIRTKWINSVIDIFSKINETRWQDFILGMICILSTYFLNKLRLKYINNKKSKKKYLLWFIGTIRNLLVVLFSIIICRLIEIDYPSSPPPNATIGAFRIVGNIPEGLPNTINPLNNSNDLDINEVLISSITIALIGYLESIAIAKVYSIKNDYKIDTNQELRAIGLSNILTSFVQGYPITGSFSRSAVNDASEVYSQTGGLITGIIVIISLLILTPIFYYIPKASLAAIIIMSVINLIKFKQIKKIFNSHPSDFFVWLVTFISCLFWSLEFGILIGIVLSISIILYNIANQNLYYLTKDNQNNLWINDSSIKIKGLSYKWESNIINNNDKFILLKPARSLEFPVANIFKDRMITIISKLKNRNHITAIILDLSSVNLIDYTCMNILSVILNYSKPSNNSKGTIIYITGSNDKIKNQLIKFKLMDINNLSHEHGEWLFKYYKTNDQVIDLINNNNLKNIENMFPYVWMIPNNYNHDTIKQDDIILGQDNKYWEYKIENNKTFWKRNNSNMFVSEV